ncbi:hypothetical protein SAMN04515674_11299 [Pseudarcicella hirudinis]|uniref:Cytokinin riboside 5'-monophosphate phosphoribohydrolase n=1 Tax=Pseudarcicella hirudinis TaxID=1079859 RepID=A0A1I5WPT5_9BACT|nr:TIGR00730 family Rossman fold protein [Pseudarcicella hirudinis]SFQ21739.1 hypothetical protein SAMN04515674_11299 [Pseudarcicella hirudinis]
MKNILVYCGSSAGFDEVYKNAAIELGKLMAEQGMRLIYGAGSVGLMGIIADSILENGGEAIGVIPSFMEKWEVQHKGLTECHVVETMHVRKQMMAEMADGVIAMAGGFGTLDELFEILTWRQLSLHAMPIGLLNTSGFYNPLLEMTERMVSEGFLKNVNKEMMMVSSTPGELLEKLKGYTSDNQTVGKWIEKA